MKTQRDLMPMACASTDWRDQQETHPMPRWKELLRRYWSTPMGCEISARWMTEENLRERTTPAARRNQSPTSK
ncbi:hypothetical protein ACFQY0_11705 [Haloferula chungangensis]|uniref:Uncharacterized protein n=1 Tax=Haloferula chungangensis TaxID=1048331 RepID=A0ABW2L9L3_9BACT